jgi:GxxExxY protein
LCGEEETVLEPSTELDLVAKAVIGAAIEVHRHLGPGFLEGVYEEALSVELGIRRIRFERQKPISVHYKGHSVGDNRVDLWVDDKLIVELKALDRILPIHQAQLISYLKAGEIPLGLLINFNEKLLRNGIQRIVVSGDSRTFVAS